MFSKAIIVLAACAGVVSAANRYNATNGGISNKSSECQLGSGKILGACGDCAQAIVDCAVNAEKSFCVNDISGFASGCGGCAVDILQCL